MFCIDKCGYINVNGRTFAIGLMNIAELLDIREYIFEHVTFKLSY